MYKFGPVQQKILLTLMSGVALGFSSSPRQYFKTLRRLRHEWKKIDQRNFNRSLRRLSNEKLIEERKKQLENILQNCKYNVEVLPHSSQNNLGRKKLIGIINKFCKNKYGQDDGINEK